jgi:CHAT domain-containing protein
VAVLADPVFQEDDPRITVGANRGAKPVPPGGQDVAQIEKVQKDLTRSAAESGWNGAGAGFGRLLETRSEAKAILRLVPPDQAKQAFDFDANKATATSPELANYRIIHFATHALFNNVHPALSGIVLSLVTADGTPQDGLLRLSEVYNLRLPAELVVLSGCQTGLGKSIRGEGLVGLTRGFMYAGAARVVVSLWKVDDKATSELMKRFYQGMLGQHLPPAAALRAAQMGMLQEKRWQSPYDWASFVLQGDWR